MCAVGVRVSGIAVLQLPWTDPDKQVPGKRRDVLKSGNMGRLCYPIGSIFVKLDLVNITMTAHFPDPY